MKTIFEHPSIPDSCLDRYGKQELIGFAESLLQERRTDLDDIERRVFWASEGLRHDASGKLKYYSQPDKCRVTKSELISLVRRLHRCGKCSR
jgi:hypothetical protein